MKQNEGNYRYDEAAAVYFNGANANGLFFDGILTHPEGAPAFAGYGEVEAEARCIRVRGNQPIVKGKLKIELHK